MKFAPEPRVVLAHWVRVGGPPLGAAEAFNAANIKIKSKPYQSQRDPSVVRKDIDSGPMVFIANQWNAAASPAKVVVFSNCQEVELLVNGKFIARQKPDSGPDTSYSKGVAVGLETVGPKSDRTGGNPFDGGNGRNLAHPPFTFTDVTWAEGSVKAMGYIDGKQAAVHENENARKARGDSHTV